MAEKNEQARQPYEAPTFEKAQTLAEITEAEDIIVPIGGGGS